MKALGLTLLLLSAAPGWSQHDEPESATHGHGAKNEIVLFLGALTNLDAEETGPSIGADYTRELTERFGIGVMGEYARAGEREAMVAATFTVRATRALKLVLAPGFLVEQHEPEHAESQHSERELAFVGRLGLGYVFERSRFTLAPSFYIDVLRSPAGSTTAHIVYGLSIGLPF